MRESARPENHAWSRKMASRYVRWYPSHAADIEAEALLGLVRAEAHANCPGPEDYQKFAYKFVAGACNDLVKKLRRQDGATPNGVDLDLLPTRTAAEDRAASPEWAEDRLVCARLLTGKTRRVFMRTYGVDRYRPLTAVAADFGLSIDQVKRLHGAALEALHDLPHFQRAS